MSLSSFAVVHERGDAAPMLDDPLAHCLAEKQTVLAYISRQALMDYFQIPGMRRSGYPFTIDVLDLKSGWQSLKYGSLTSGPRIPAGSFWRIGIPACGVANVLFNLLQQLRQLGDVGCYAPGFRRQPFVPCRV